MNYDSLDSVDGDFLFLKGGLTSSWEDFLDVPQYVPKRHVPGAGDVLELC